MADGFIPEGVDFDKERLLFVMMQGYMDALMESIRTVLEDAKWDGYFENAVKAALDDAAHQVLFRDKTIHAAIKKRVLELIDSKGK